jgi:predicted nucleic acid-binding Zn ribbon protein
VNAQSDRIDTVLRQLHETEHLRRRVATSSPEPDTERHSLLASKVRNQIDQLAPGDLKSLTLRMVVDTLNGNRWDRCEGCGRPDYLGEARR